LSVAYDAAVSDVSNPVLGLQAAADELGVHYQTAYRWVRNGRLPARLVDGKYFVSTTDLADVDANRRQSKTPTTPGPDRLRRQSERMHDALLNGDESNVRKIARSLVDEGTTIVDLVEQVISPPLRAIGQAWHDGDLTIWVEHRASAIIERALGDLLPNPRGRRRGTAMVAAVSGDLHSLPTIMATVALREANWEVHHLGADMPPEELVSFCAAHDDVDVAVLSSTNPDVANEAQNAAELIRAMGIPTLVGGPGGRLSQLIDDVRDAVAARSD
jgi:methanogenic corrinoid protein MtbC1